MYDTLLIAEPDNNLGNAEEERLRPELEQFPLVFHQISVIPDLR